MNDQPDLTREAHERYQQARIVFVLRLLFYIHLVAYVATNGVFVFFFGRVGLWWGLGIIAHGVLTFVFGRQLAVWVERRVRASAGLRHR